MKVQPRTSWRTAWGGAAAYTTSGCTADGPGQIGQATFPFKIEQESWATTLDVAFILESRVEVDCEHREQSGEISCYWRSLL